MANAGETQVLRPVQSGGDVVLMHGMAWRVREKRLVRIAELTDPAGLELAPGNWRSKYVGAYGQAVFADDGGVGAVWVVQVKRLAYPNADGAGLNATCDMLRTSTGTLARCEGGYELVTRRTRYLFAPVVGAEARALEEALGVLV